MFKLARAFAAVCVVGASFSLFGCASLSEPDSSSADGTQTKKSISSSQTASSNAHSNSSEAGATEPAANEDGSEQERFPYREQSYENTGASVVGYEEVSDPLEPVNRVIFKFNDISYRYFLSPVASGYKKITPDPVEDGVSNVFDNLYEPISTVNHLFRLQPKQAGVSVGRFLINSTVGLLGIFDPASAWFSLEEKKSTLGNTMMDYNIGQGVYIVIPFIGPSNARDGVSQIFDYMASPLNAVENDVHRRNLRLLQSLDNNKNELDQYPEIVKEAEDPYVLLRGFYMQNDKRDAEQIQQQDLAARKRKERKRY